MWALIKTLELGVERKRLINLDHFVKIRPTEESDGEYHKKHSGTALVFMTDVNVQVENFPSDAIVGEIERVFVNLKECNVKVLF